MPSTTTKLSKNESLKNSEVTNLIPWRISRQPPLSVTRQNRPPAVTLVLRQDEKLGWLFVVVQARALAMSSRDDRTTIPALPEHFGLTKHWGRISGPIGS